MGKQVVLVIMTFIVTQVLWAKSDELAGELSGLMSELSTEIDARSVDVELTFLNPVWLISHSPYGDGFQILGKQEPAKKKLAQLTTSYNYKCRVWGIIKKDGVLIHNIENCKTISKNY